MSSTLRHRAVARLGRLALAALLIGGLLRPALSHAAGAPVAVYLPIVNAPFPAPAWSLPDTVSPPTPSAAQLQPTLALDEQGNALAAWIEDRGDVWRVYAATRPAAAPAAWTQPAPVHEIGSGQFRPVAAFDATGRAYLAWLENTAAASRLLLAERAPGGAWQVSEPLPPAASLQYGCFDLTTDRQGGVHLLVNVADGPASAPPTDLYYVTRTPAGSWLPPERVNAQPGTLSHEYGPPGCPSLAVEPDGVVHAAWRDMRDMPWPTNIVAHIYYAQRVNGVWSANELVDGFSNEDHPSLAANGDGNVYLAWADGRYPGGGVRFTFRGRDGVWRPSVRVNAPASGGSGWEWLQGPSLGLDARGNLYIIWPAGVATHATGPTGSGGSESYFFDSRPPVGDRNTAEAWGVDTPFRTGNDLTGEQDFAVNRRGDFAAVWTEYPGVPQTPAIWSAARIR